MMRKSQPYTKQAPVSASCARQCPGGGAGAERRLALRPALR